MKLKAWNFIKKETLAQVFSCEFYEISKHNFFAEHLQAIDYVLQLLCFDFESDY